MSANDGTKRSGSPAGNDVLRAEALAEEAQKRLAEEGKRGLENRCPECGALGSLEEQDDGAVRCIDCDEILGATQRLGGLGRK
ncbi:MAG: hypothetical protein HOW73_23325 [Polyangiaceae bacterium]|nr:hypothetical protein [Polyangiaceae bacterium]